LLGVQAAEAVLRADLRLVDGRDDALPVEPEQLEGTWHLLAFIPCKTVYVALALGTTTVQDATQQFRWDAGKGTLNVTHTHKPVAKDKDKTPAPVTRSLRLAAPSADNTSGTYSSELKTTEWRLSLSSKLGNMPLGLTLLVLASSPTSSGDGGGGVAPCLGCTGGGGGGSVGRLLLGNADRSVLFLLAREPDTAVAAEMTKSAGADFGYWELDKRLVAVTATMATLAKKK